MPALLSIFLVLYLLADSVSDLSDLRNTDLSNQDLQAGER